MSYGQVETNSLASSVHDDAAGLPSQHNDDSVAPTSRYDDSAAVSMEAGADDALTRALSADPEGTNSVFARYGDGGTNPTSLSVSLSRSEAAGHSEEPSRAVVACEPPQHPTLASRGAVVSECRGLRSDLATLRMDVTTLVSEQCKWIQKMNRVVKKVLPAMVAAVAVNHHQQSFDCSTSDSRGESPMPGTPLPRSLAAPAPVVLSSLHRADPPPPATASPACSPPPQPQSSGDAFRATTALVAPTPQHAVAQPQHSGGPVVLQPIARGAAAAQQAAAGGAHPSSRGAGGGVEGVGMADAAMQGIAGIEAHVRHLRARPLDLSHPTVTGVAHGGGAFFTEPLGSPLHPTAQHRNQPSQQQRPKNNHLRSSSQQPVLTMTYYGPPDMAHVASAPHPWALGTSMRHQQLAAEEAQLTAALRFSSLRTATASPPQPHQVASGVGDADIETSPAGPTVADPPHPQHYHRDEPTNGAASNSRALAARCSVSPPDDPLMSSSSWLQRGIQALSAPLQAVGTAVLRSTGATNDDVSTAADAGKRQHPSATSTAAAVPLPHPPTSSPRHGASQSARLKRGLVMTVPGEANGGRQRHAVGGQPSQQQQRGPFAVVVGRGGPAKPLERFANSNSSSTHCTNTSTLTDIPTAWTPPMSSSGRRGLQSDSVVPNV